MVPDVNRRQCRLAVLVLPLILLATSGSARADCLDYSEWFHWASVTATGEGAETVALAGDIAFVGGMGTGLRVLDLHDPAAPDLLATLPTPGVISDIDLTAGYAVLGIVLDTGAPGLSALWIVDISDPAAPAPIGGIEMEGHGGFVDIAGSMAYFANYLPSPPEGDSGLVAIDLTNPTNPVLVGRLSFGGYAHAMAVTENLLHVGYDFFGSTGYSIKDISDFANPLSLGSIPGDGIGFYGRIWTSGHYAYAACDLGLAVVDFADPAAPEIVGSVFVIDPQSAAFAGGRAYVAGAGLSVLDISDPSTPALLFTAGGGYHGLDVSGTLLCSALGPHGLLTIDISAGEPAPSLAVPLAAPSLAVAEQNGLAYVCGENGILRVVDASDPSSPWLRGSVDLAVPHSELVLAGDLVYALNSGGLRIVDVADPDAPQLVGSIDLQDYTIDIVLQGGLAYVSRLLSGLHILDISNPAAPALLGTVDIGQFPEYMAISGDALYVSDLALGLLVLAIADPLQPVLVDQIDFPQHVEADLTVADGYLYVSGESNGLLVYDISTPLAPVQIPGPGFGDAGDVEIAGNRMVMVSDGELLFLERSDPLALRLLGSVGAVGAQDVALGEGAVFVAGDAPNGLAILPHACAPTAAPVPHPAPLALRAWPNPFNPQVTLAFSLEAPAWGTLEVLDLAGRRVITLAEGSFASGEQRVFWDGRDAAGRDVASGVYFARLAVGGQRRLGKLVLLR